MRPRVLLPAVAAAALLAGCGQAAQSTKSFDGEEQRVADLVGDLGTAGNRTEPADICDDLLTTGLRDSVAAGGRSCTAEMRKAIRDADVFDIEVTDVTVSGDRATAQVRSTSGGDEVERTLRFAKQSGAWRIADFG